MATEITTIEQYNNMDSNRQRYFLFEMMKYPINDKKIIEKILEDSVSYPASFVNKIIQGKINEIIEELLEYSHYYLNYDDAISYYFAAKRYDMINFFIDKFNGISTTTWATSLIECAKVGNLEEFKYLIDLIPKIYVSDIRSKEDHMEKALRLFNITGMHCYFEDENTDEYIINYILNISYEESLYNGKENIRDFIRNNKLVKPKEDSEIKSEYARIMNQKLKNMLKK